jgi:hypothetical protein
LDMVRLKRAFTPLAIRTTGDVCTLRSRFVIEGD